MHSTLKREVKRKVHIIPDIKDYATPVISKNSLTDFSSISNFTLIVNKCSDVILSKFKVVKFTIK